MKSRVPPGYGLVSFPDVQNESLYLARDQLAHLSSHQCQLMAAMFRKRKRIVSLSSCVTYSRAFSTLVRIQANRAIVYSQNGQPADVLRAINIPSLTAPLPQTVNVRFVLAPINPADVNVIEGVYPSKPQRSSFPGVQGEVFVGGNEGLAEITDVGEGVRSVERGDWVIMKASQVGTWRGAANLREGQILKVPRLNGLSDVNAATMMVRPC